ncbi:MAG: ABC transporter substrate-binding protein [Deltaproteobacteria bacterium]|nr:ABC transporter substrate-binding protein [Deltaproteobacteria bacterium]
MAAMPALLSFLPLFLYVLFPSDAVAERDRTVIPRATLNYLSVPVAEVKGFFRDEGLENETIVIPGATAIAALVSGDVDYSGVGGTGMRAALRGAPIKAVMFQTEKVTWYLIAAPEITKGADLKGNRVAVGTVGDTPGRFSHRLRRAQWCCRQGSHPSRHAVSDHNHDDARSKIRRHPGRHNQWR